MLRKANSRKKKRHDYGAFKRYVYGLQILPFAGSSFDNLVKEQNFDWLIFRLPIIEQLSAFVQFLRIFLMIP